MFMDYYGMPHLKTHLRALVAFIDVEHRKAAIPGDGNAKVVFTLTGDLAKFVVALLDLPTEKWPRSAMVVGDRLTLNELVEMAEKIVGNKFDVEYDSVAKLRKGVPAELPGNIPHYVLECTRLRVTYRLDFELCLYFVETYGKGQWVAETGGTADSRLIAITRQRLNAVDAV
ncbi:phosphoserine aminotransferase [Neofusicoccum parvum]|nr:phosphoserine aminotransferase [Neofusicoccum parvum]